MIYASHSCKLCVLVLQSTLSPSLTYASTLTSHDSWLSQVSSLNREVTDASPTTVDSSSASQPAIQFGSGLSHTSNPPPEEQRMDVRSRKLRKTKPESGGYESDAGYVSDAVAKDKKKKSKKKSEGRATGEESDGGYLSEVLARRRRKKKEKRERESKSMTDDEVDGGYTSSVSKKEKKAKKSSTAGDESDGGNLSEVSSKRKLFNFRLKPRRRQDSSDVSLHDVIPPVPSLPTVSLPIADRFGLSLSEFGSSRTSTPAPSERTSTQRSSDETSAADISLLDAPSVAVPSSLPSPNPSIKGLTSAFNDAQSVRTPSTDVLRAFGRQAMAGAPRSPLFTTSSTSPLVSKDSPAMPSSFSAPALTMSRPKRNSSMKKVTSGVTAPLRPGLSIETQHKADPDALIPVTLTPPTPTPAVLPFGLISKSSNVEANFASLSPSTHSLPITPSSSGIGKYQDSLCWCWCP